MDTASPYLNKPACGEFIGFSRRLFYGTIVRVLDSGSYTIKGTTRVRGRQRARYYTFPPDRVTVFAVSQQQIRTRRYSSMWTSIQDALPNVGELVLCAMDIDGGLTTYAIAYLVAPRQWHVDVSMTDCSADTLCLVHTVTRWMPIPR